MNKAREEVVTHVLFDDTVKPKQTRSLWEMFINYYSQNEYVRTPKQIRRDKTIFFGRVYCRPWMIISAAVVIQFCMGSFYTWAIFNKPIDTYVFNDPKADHARLTFYITLGVLGAAGAAFGPWIESHAPNMCAALAATILYAGHLTAALGLACKEIGMLYFGYGFIGGIGFGVGYVTTIDAVVKWYPKARGFASGLAVCGFGSGALAYTNLNAALVRTFSIPVAFVVLGSINFVVMMLCATVMRPPPPSYNLPGVQVDMDNELMDDGDKPSQYQTRQTIKGKSAAIGGQTITVGSESGDPVLIIPLSQALSSRDFWLLWVAFFFNVVFGVVFISNLAAMTTNMFGSSAPIVNTTIVTITGAFNASGRLFFAWASDWLGRRQTFLLIITIQIVLVSCLMIALPQRAFWPFVVMAWLGTMCYGGSIGTIPAVLADMFGPSNMSACHGMLLTSWPAASISGGVIYSAVVHHLVHHKGHAYSDPIVYVTNLYWILSLLICGLAIFIFVRITPRERMFPRVRGQLFYHPLAGLNLRLVDGVRQNGLQDYEFLAVPAETAADSDANTAPASAPPAQAFPMSEQEKIIANRDSRTVGDNLPFDSKQDFQEVSIDSSDSFGSSLHDDSTRAFSPKQNVASEAYNYVSENKTLSQYGDNANASGSCVQLVCPILPPRKCLILFGKVRLEVVSREEIASIWRMYLSCALLASTEAEK